MMALAKKSKGATRLTELKGAWKSATPIAPRQARVRPNTQPSLPSKPRKDHKRLRFRQFIGNHSLREAAATEADIAGASLIIIDGSRTGAELKQAVNEFGKDCIDMSSDGHTVIAMAVALN
jgi:hypothetical protein